GGNALAQAYHGFMYEKGRGVPEDYVLAYKWLNLAAAKGTEFGTHNERVKSSKEAVEKKMTKQQIAEGQRLSREWFSEMNFLEENKNKDGVIVTASGLQYKVLLEGSGKQPLATDIVTVHYEGTLTNGTVFDSSISRGQPAEFPLNSVITGWTEGVQLMKEGAKYKFFIPSDLAYGKSGTPGGPIGQNEDLIFTVELIRVN
ncbi:FKBP-type peptidyl-prolyl cis-trans isomerase, partial [Emcibacteraceae bacterium]|nr:FKBP-type peptidyl-prolyl cis-trans isomerase [Emcibacteraceae bacterium]